jgi:2-dehydropantoate 2-reductase
MPTIAIVGAGAVGAYYGSRLWESGAYDVKFQMRGEHYEKSRELGLNVTSVHGDMFIPPESLQVYTDTKEIGPVDWVIVALKSSALDAIPELIYPLLTPGKTRVLTIMNGLIEEDLISSLKELAGEDPEDSSLKCCAALYGGMALVCCNRLGPGRVDHSFAGLLSGGIAACSTTTTKEDNKEAYEKLWEPTKVEIAYEPSLLAGRWRKVCARLLTTQRILTIIVTGFSCAVKKIAECLELAFQWNFCCDGWYHCRQDRNRSWTPKAG